MAEWLWESLSEKQPQAQRKEMNTPRLHHVTHCQHTRRRDWNHFCGPAALSSITGKTAEFCAERLEAVRGKGKIYGVEKAVMIDTLFSLGYQASHLWFMRPSPRKPNLQEWIRDHSGNDNHMYLINVTGHYLVYKNGILIDNDNGWIKLKNRSRSRRYAHTNAGKTVKHVWQIMKPA